MVKVSPGRLSSKTEKDLSKGNPEARRGNNRKYIQGAVSFNTNKWVEADSRGLGDPKKSLQRRVVKGNGGKTGRGTDENESPN